jgi:molybdopterin converting factor subunit 1
VKVRVLFFAALRERARASEIVVDIEPDTTVGELWDRLCVERPALAAFQARIAFARNQEYVDSKMTLQDNDEVAFIPPVSGGSVARTCSKS